MEVYIPTLSRPSVQETWSNLPVEVQRNTKLVVDADEAPLYSGYPCVVLPSGIRGIGKVREWICLNAEEPKVLMLDDDLRFAHRRGDERTRFREARNSEVMEAFSQIEQLLNKYAHVGMSTREGGNRETQDFIKNSRTLRVLAYRVDILYEEGISFSRLPVMEDFDVHLSLLERGYENVRLNWIVQDQRGSGLAGGCSTYRTSEVQSKAAHLLASHHPKFVSVVQKTTKTAWGGGTRTDVRIQWKDALASAPAIKKIEPIP